MLRGALVGVALLALLGALGARVGWVAVPLERPEGHAFWVASRAAGFAAYAALTLEVVLGLLLSTSLADAWIARARTADLHRWLSLTAIGLGFAHGMLLVGDRYVRFDALDVLIPFVARYRPTAVALGVLAAYAAVIVHVSSALRARIGARAWRALHFLAFALYLAATAHGLLAGSDGRATSTRLVYAASAALVLWLTIYRAGTAIAITARRDPEASRGAARAGSTGVTAS
ncbi:MAG: ferric reductase-like transmembrane domain-containing protein [Polyangiaceae bacterium]